ncbi:TIGR01459 family HAD-type hydrolase [Micromonospora sp. DT4]
MRVHASLSRDQIVAWTALTGILSTEADGYGMTGVTEESTCAPVMLSTGLRDVVTAYRAVILDIWGVLIDGKSALPEAAECLRQLRRHGIAVLLLSNSSRGSDNLRSYLNELGVPVDRTDHVVTSGELAAEHLSGTSHRRALQVGSDEGTDWLVRDGRVLVRTADQADVVVATGAVRDESLLPFWMEQLRSTARRGVPMICANPDRELYVGSRRIRAAGHLADLYVGLGGTVTWCGKPMPEAYHSCLTRLATDAAHVVAVGDSLDTDIAGAACAGLHRVLVLDTGVHRDMAGLAGNGLSEAIRERGTALPTFTMDRLRW